MGDDPDRRVDGERVTRRAPRHERAVGLLDAALAPVPGQGAPGQEGPGGRGLQCVIGGDLRSGGWEAYLHRTDDFMRFAAHRMIVEMLTLHGGESKRRYVWLLRPDRH